MTEFVFSLALMIAVVGSLAGWAYRHDRPESPDGEKYAVADLALGTRPVR